MNEHQNKETSENHTMKWHMNVNYEVEQIQVVEWNDA